MGIIKASFILSPINAVGDNVITTRPAKMRGIHEYSFRCGEWGELIGVKLITPHGLSERPCYMVLYEDGLVHYIPVSDAHIYEIGT